jgi:ABC-type transporter MlaC component
MARLASRQSPVALVAGLRRALIAIGLLAFLAQAAASAAQGAADPAAFIAGFVQRGADLAAARSTLDDAALEPWRRLVEESLDLPKIAAFVVGAPWRAATAGERSELVRLIGGQIAALYARRVAADHDAALTITGAQELGPEEALVTSHLTRRDGTVESIDWLVGGRAATGFGIFDIVSDGQSLAATKRSEYGILLQRSRGDVAGLIEALRLGRP